MHKTHRQIFDFERRKASAAARRLRLWKERGPYLRRRAEQEEAGQFDLNLDAENDMNLGYDFEDEFDA
ncbi:hypothetical protein MRB56_12575 [Halomonas cupida]|uniref:hypothetical protein n=1 Tax=Halomonas cupida TaxID=44933 RepID=UPI0039B67F40